MTSYEPALCSVSLILHARSACSLALWRTCDPSAWTGGAVSALLTMGVDWQLSVPGSTQAATAGMNDKVDSGFGGLDF